MFSKSFFVFRNEKVTVIQNSKNFPNKKRFIHNKIFFLKTKLEKVALNKIDLLETDSCACESKYFGFETKLSFERVPGGKSERAWAKLHFVVDTAATRLL